MTKTYNIRREADRAALEAAGWTWVTTIPRGENIGTVVTKHRTIDAAERAAKGRELAIRDVLDTTAGAW